MYCPKCGHHSASADVRFCPGCGFRLDAVSELVSIDGIIDPEKTQRPRNSLLKKGTLLGMSLMYLGAILLASGMHRGPYRSESIVFLTVFWAALVILVSIGGPLIRALNRVFSDANSSSTPIRSNSRGAAVPPSQSVIMQNIDLPRTSTKKIAHPPSVT